MNPDPKTDARRAALSEKIMLLRREKHALEQRYHAVRANRALSEDARERHLRAALHGLPFETWQQVLDGSIARAQGRLAAEELPQFRPRALAMLLVLAALCFVALFLRITPLGFTLVPVPPTSAPLFFFLPFLCAALIVSYVVSFASRRSARQPPARR